MHNKFIISFLCLTIQVRWEYWSEDKNAYMSYPEVLNFKFENAKKAGENTITFKESGKPCKIDIAKGLEIKDGDEANAVKIRRRKIGNNRLHLSIKSC